jgi:hypothetical protein
MQFLIDLWVPILVSAVAVFFVSSLVHMVLGYHKHDYAGLPNEDELLASMRSAGVAPGEYVFPYCVDMKELASESMIKKMEEGPIGFMSVKPSGSWAMGKTLGQWFLNCVVVSALIAYVFALAVDPAATFLHKFRVAGAIAFLAYAGCTASSSIWKAQNWSTTFKHIFDGVLYGLATGAVFAWLGPSVG